MSLSLVMINSHLILFIGCLSLLIITLFYKSVVLIPNTFENPEILSANQNLHLPNKIQENVVKIVVAQTFGSGIIIQKNNNIYSVVTNRHVVDYGDRYDIRTADNQIHSAKLIVISRQNDLAILQFASDRLYSVATINTEPLQLHKPLLAAGFPFHSDCLQITSGRLLQQTKKPLKQGYQLGYSNNIPQGMSGGAIFNYFGEVVGVNGRSANPIIPNYQYQDETYPSKQIQQQMMQLSWGIPIIKAVELLPER
jgi:S1-C subfamily serine protease